MKTLIEYIAKSLVDKPEEVEVKELRANRPRFWNSRLLGEDLGKVIGRQGRTARPCAPYLEQLQFAPKNGQCLKSSNKSAPGDLVEMGSIGRPHGLMGEVGARWEGETPVPVGGKIWLQAEGEDPRPFEVEAARVHRGYRSFRWPEFMTGTRPKPCEEPGYSCPVPNCRLPGKTRPGWRI